jgi:hypothetical protein
MQMLLASFETGKNYNLFGWGFNNDATIGDGTVVYKSSPVQIGTLNNWTSISFAQETGAATQSDGTLWNWGAKVYDGLFITFPASSPIQIGALTNWASICLGAPGSDTNNYALKSDNSLWVYGKNSGGSLGLGNDLTTNSPVQLGGTDWYKVAGGGGNGYAISIKTNNTLWSWGYNLQGELGQNTAVTSVESPVQIGALATWSECSAGVYDAAAIKTDGTLWTWGFNRYGAAGKGNTITYSSPVQVGALTNWSKVSSGLEFTMAVKTDGTLWAWGHNVYGALGQNNAINYSSPVQIGSATDWSAVAAGRSYTIALKTGGTLWSWGFNHHGQLGQNNTTYKSSPVQVGSLTNWKILPSSIFNYTAAAITEE